MEVRLVRKKGFKESTIGELSIDGRNEKWAVCEDAVREPSTGCPPKMTMEAWVASWKIKGVTAIPTGRYKLAWTYSSRFKRYTLEILKVPGFGGVRIHPGNSDRDTEGCPLPGLNSAGPVVEHSSAAVKQINDILVGSKGLRETSWITITNEIEP